MDNLRILVYSNPLVVDKIGKKFLYDKDSGFLYTKNLISTMPKDYRYYWLVPENLSPQDKLWFAEANQFVEPVPYPYSTSIHQNRYEFYGASLKKSFPYTKDIDAIICNQPEVSMNLRVWSTNQRRDDPVILSYYHWIDCKESRSFAQELGGYFWRQYDGMLASDAVLFHGSYAEKLFLGELHSKVKNITYPRTKYFHPPATRFGMDAMPIPLGKKIILFNHRLNATSNWKDFLSKCDQLYKIRQDFIVWITDDQNIQEVEALQKPYIYVKKIPSSSYGYVMSKCHFAVCNHKGYATWNMAILDTFYNGCFTLVPEDGVFPSMFMGGSRGIYHNRKNLVEIMDEYLNKNESILKSMAKRIVDKNLALFDNNEGAIATELIHTGISNKMAKSTPEKYDEVMQLIEAGIMMSKGEIVNDLWSFHVNSNFQKIRWKLLEDGVKDDTSQSVTIYSKDEIEPTLSLKQLSF